jgi:hypothetical protein
MKQLRFPYQIIRPPRAVRHARLDNIALVPASLLPKKGKYQTIANNLPKGSVLICQTEKTQKISHILERVASLLHEKGHVVKTLPYSLI